MAIHQKLAKILHYFPLLDLPLFLSEDQIEIIDKEVDLFPQVFIDEVIQEWEEGDIDEYTEFLPIGQINIKRDFYCILYWKGSLLSYEYIVITVDKEGELIDKKVIAGTEVMEDFIQRSVAHIDPELMIHIVAGRSTHDDEFSSDTTRSFTMEIMPDGEIIFNTDNDGL